MCACICVFVYVYVCVRVCVCVCVCVVVTGKSHRFSANRWKKIAFRCIVTVFSLVARYSILTSRHCIYSMCMYSRCSDCMAVAGYSGYQLDSHCIYSTC